MKSKLEPLVFDAEMMQDCREWAAKLNKERRLYHWHGGRENCARGYQTPAAAFRGWMVSSGHRVFLHNREIKYAAIGIYSTENGYAYYVFRGTE